MYRLLLDLSSDPIFTFDTDCRYSYANQAFADGIGKNLEDVLGKTLWDVFSEEEAAKRYAHLKWVFDHKEPQTFEIRIPRPDADRFYLTTLKPILDDQGRVTAVLANSKDISERKRAEETLKQNEAYTRTILDSVSDQVAVIDQFGVITAVNKVWRSFAQENSPHPGTPTDRTDLGTNYLEVCRASAESDSGSAQSAAEGIQAVLDGRLPTFALEYPCNMPEQKLWFRMRVTPLGIHRNGAVIAHSNITELIQANEALRQSDAFLKAITAAVPGVIYQFSMLPDGQWKFLFLSKRIEELYEVTAEAAQQNHALLTDCILAEDRASHRESVEHAAATLGAWEHEHRIKTPNGNFKWVRGQAVPQVQGDGSILWNGILTDITEHKRVEAALQESEQKFRLIAENTSDGITVFDREGRVQYVSPSVVKQLGYSEQEELSRSSSDVYAMLDPAGRDDLFQGINNAIQMRKERLTYAYRVKHKAGHYVWREDNTKFLYSSAGEYEGAYVISRDITERKRMEEEVWHLAYFDSLTKLPNRLMLSDRLGQTIAASKRSGRHAAVLVLDLDNFKPLNDEHGHLVGDLLLAEVARRLVACVREVDTVARFGGDEFVVLLSDLSEDKTESKGRAQAVAEKIRQALQAPYLLSVKKDNQSPSTIEHHCSASIGVALFLNHEADPNDLLKWADCAMYQAKDAGRNAIRFYGLSQ